jgi:hypothetical protein
LWAMALQAGTALADAIPPPPENCPAGKVGDADHNGQRCVDPAPEDCPPGYRGQIGGQCVLHQCGTDEHCGPDKRCRDVELCYVPHEVWVEYGKRPVVRDNLLAGPPVELDEPKTVFEPVGVCQEEGDCESPSECRPGKLCFPTGVATTAAPSRPRRAEPTGEEKSHPSGCGKGCATRGSGGALGGVLLLALGASALRARAWRRRRRPSQGGSGATP